MMGYAPLNIEEASGICFARSEDFRAKLLVCRKRVRRMAMLRLGRRKVGGGGFNARCLRVRGWGFSAIWISTADWGIAR